MKLKKSLLAVLAAFTGTASAAPIPVTGSMTYNQNFDSLTAADVPWTDDSTLPGWRAEINQGNTAIGNAQAADGNVDLPGLLNLGASGAPDRALGSKVTGTGNFANAAYGVQFRNTSANPVQFSQLTYTGELWRTNSGSVIETFTLFYSISNTEITDVISGGNSATAAAGAGFTALGAGASWASPTNTPAATALDGNDPLNRATVTFTPASTITLAPNQYLMIKWTDTNLGSSDGFQGIDDVSVDFTAVSGLLTPTISAMTRNTAGTPADPTDDTFGFTVSVAGSGAVGTGWTTTDVSAPNATSANYGTPVVWTGFPAGGPKTVIFRDNVTAALTGGITVDPPRIIGTNDIFVAGSPLLDSGAAITGWTIDEVARTMTLTAQPAQVDQVIDTEIINLAGIGFVKFTAELDAITGTSSGFEAADGFGLEASINGGAFVSILGAANDPDGNGRLNGAAAAPSELPDATAIPDVTKSFSFEYIIPDTANSVQIRIIGNNNSGSETFVVKNVTFSPPSASIFAVPGIATVNNKGTVNPADDEFSVPVTISGVNLGASTGWTSNEVPSRTGLYADPQPVTFGPYPVSGGAKTVLLTDNLNGAITTSVVLSPPTPTLTISAPTNITRINNGPGVADDVVTFDVTITGANGGPGWTATGGTPTSGTYSAAPVTFSVPAGAGIASATIVVTDNSYTAVTATAVANFPGIYIIGQKNLGAGLSDVNSTTVNPPDNAWVNDPVARTLTMNDGDAVAAGVKTITSEAVNLSGVSGTVNFSATLETQDTSSGFEAADTFVAELLLDDGVNPVTTVNLILPHDTDASQVLEGAELAVAGGAVGNPTILTFALNHTIPDNIVSATLVIRGINDSANEFTIVRNVLFSTGPVVSDSDGDGMSNTDEATAGTNPNDPLDVLRISHNPVTPNVFSFPTKAGRFYKVYSSANLASWAPTALATIVGDGTVKTFDITSLIGAGRQYFRLHVMTTDGPWN